MANTRIENRVDARAELARGQEAARNGRGLAEQGESPAAAFASLLASLDGLSPSPLAAPLGLAQDAAGGLQAQAALVSSANALPALADPLPGPADPAALAQTMQAAMPLPVDAVPDQGGTAAQLWSGNGKPLPSAQARSASQDDALLLAASGQIPWASLVGQTAQLDGKADRDLVQGAAGDWLSGRSNAALSLLRQEQALGGAHAAFMSPQQAGEGAVTAASPLAADAAGALLAPDGAPVAGAPVAGQSADAPGVRSSLAAAADTLAAAMDDARGSAGARSALPAAQAQPPADLSGGVRQDAALASGIALQGMAAVKPEQWRGLFERARDARSGAVSGAADAAGGLDGVAAAVGAAQAGQQAGQQPAGQDASALAQPQPDGRAAASEREQEISEKVAFWVHSKSQNASLTVDHEGRAIQVQVSLQGNEAHVRFGSSEAQAREWLGNGADQLRELLQSQGLQLGGVSVDAGGQQGAGADGRQGADAQARQGRVSAVVDAAGLAGGGAPSRGAARTAGGVDLFV